MPGRSNNVVGQTAVRPVDQIFANIRDKAIEAYAQQARNLEAERLACEIGLRAERRCGQLLREREMAKGAAEPGTNRGATHSRRTRASPLKTLAVLGISHDQPSKWQKLADIPEDDFEATLTAPGPKPSTIGTIREFIPATPRGVDPKALWLWGRLLDFERQGLLLADPSVLVGTMLDHVQETIRIAFDPATFSRPGLRLPIVLEVMRAANDRLGANRQVS
jgi:hypothetical protein